MFPTRELGELFFEFFNLITSFSLSRKSVAKQNPCFQDLQDLFFFFFSQYFVSGHKNLLQGLRFKVHGLRKILAP
jgi:hypothetical protein